LAQGSHRTKYARSTMAAPSSHADVVHDFWRFFSRHPEGGDVMKYSYMVPGDRFGAITQLPEYYVTNDELRTLDEQLPWLASLVSTQCRSPGDNGAGGPFIAAMPNHVVEWGPGPGHIVQRKTLPLLQALAAGPRPLSYEAVDVSAAYTREAACVVTKGLAGTGVSEAAVQESVADFMVHAAAQPSDGNDEQSTCMLFWGVTFGNFDGLERERLIAGIKSYDIACFTVDHNLDLSSLTAAYDNAPNHSFLMGPLEYFWSVVEADPSVEVSGFDLSAWEAEFSFEAEHHDASGAVDELVVAGYMRSRRDQTFVFAGHGLDGEVVRVAAGERFQVVQSRKYSEGRVRELVDSVPSKQPRHVVASGLFGEGSRIGLVVVSRDTSSNPTLERATDSKDAAGRATRAGRVAAAGVGEAEGGMGAMRSDKDLEDGHSALQAEHRMHMVAGGA